MFRLKLKNEFIINDIMELVCVVIPVYKDNLSHSENLSLVQCCKILQHYPVTIISPSCLKISEYETILQKYSVAYSVKYLDNYYFCNIQSYNRLLLSDLFYQCFIDYRFILIYQLDAYVFKDELMYWCNKGYDYVGAPLIGKYIDNFFID